ncbi:hypothetical protein LR48_Vigan06g027000 [Vigna angularis]|uniref:Uncharacterized protein n=1 Tax=Phaseolus angularis TaxID=3914 RepID=A0A0L9UR25_PHAAN|nr:hypothetical protein LR48_Vigan06g027000 [Vigna angularis]
MPESNQNQNQNQNYHDHQQALISNKPFQGMIQLSDLNNTNTPSASNLFNLPFLSNRGHHTPNYSEEHHFNPTEASNFFTEGTIISTDHQTSSATAPSLFSTTLQNTTNLSHMSATALLQKAAQMGAASSSTNNSASSLLRSLASKSDHRPLISAANYSNYIIDYKDTVNDYPRENGILYKKFITGAQSVIENVPKLLADAGSVMSIINPLEGTETFLKLL